MQSSPLSRQVGAGVLVKYVLYIIGAANDGKDEMHWGRHSCLTQILSDAYLVKWAEYVHAVVQVTHEFSLKQNPFGTEKKQKVPLTHTDSFCSLSLFSLQLSSFTSYWLEGIQWPCGQLKL